jgi:hypothetical protein
MVPDYKVDEVANMDAIPVVRNTPGRQNAEVIAHLFYYKPTSSVAATKIIALAKLPVGFTILGGVLLSNAWVATSTAHVGLAGADGNGYYDKAGTLADDNDLFASALGVATAGAYDFANTTALGYGTKLDKECYLCMTLNTAGMDGSADIAQGYVFGTID